MKILPKIYTLKEEAQLELYQLFYKNIRSLLKKRMALAFASHRATLSLAMSAKSSTIFPTWWNFTSRLFLVTLKPFYSYLKSFLK